MHSRLCKHESIPNKFHSFYSISLLSSLLPLSSSTLLSNAINLELDEVERPPPLLNVLEEQQFPKVCANIEEENELEADTEEDIAETADDEESKDPVEKTENFEVSRFELLKLESKLTLTFSKTA